MAKLNAALLRRAVAVSKAASKVQRELTVAFEERYGRTYSDVDCDPLIDALDYGGGSGLTVEDCDRFMAEYDVYPLSDPVVKRDAETD